MAHFKIEQIALFPVNSVLARNLLADLGLTEWHHDNVEASGEVFNDRADNEAHLAFNYQAGNGEFIKVGDEVQPQGYKPLELEVLDYTNGDNWMTRNMDAGEVSATCGAVSHLGMHVTDEQLQEFDAIMRKHEIAVAQRVHTKSHTNPAIKDSRRYKYVIYDTRSILGVDLKFIVRKEYHPKAVKLA